MMDSVCKGTYTIRIVADVELEIEKLDVLVGPSGNHSHPIALDLHRPECSRMGFDVMENFRSSKVIHKQIAGLRSNGYLWNVPRL
jgi:hypothetical protein